MILLEGAVHEVLEEKWCRRVPLLNGLDGQRLSGGVEPNGENLKGTGLHDPKPRRIASVGKQSPQGYHRRRIGFRIVTCIHDIEKRCALMLGDGREFWRLTGSRWKQVEVVELRRGGQLLVESDVVRTAVA